MEMKWLFLVHQVQTPNSRERVKVWRLTKKAGAVLYRNSVYVLPHSKDRLEDFQWLAQQIRDSKGEASVFVSESRDAAENRNLRALFVRGTDESYRALITDSERLIDRIRSARAEGRWSERLAKSLAKKAGQLQTALMETQQTDFFGAPLAIRTSKVVAALAKAIETAQPQTTAVVPLRHHHPKEFQGKTWATREHIHIDRLCSAWLIRRFIDPTAQFVFASEAALPKDAIPFDTFGVEFSHHGEDCTFETLLKSFQLDDAALTELAEIIHDIDLKDQRFGRSEAAGLDLVVRALCAASRNDQQALRTGSAILDTLHCYLSNVNKHKIKRR
jgi:hypothetical protein